MADSEPKELFSTCTVELGDDVDTVTIEMQLPPGEGTHFTRHFSSFMKWFTEHSGGEYEKHDITTEGRTH